MKRKFKLLYLDGSCHNAIEREYYKHKRLGFKIIKGDAVQKISDYPYGTFLYGRNDEIGSGFRILKEEDAIQSYPGGIAYSDVYHIVVLNRPSSITKSRESEFRHAKGWIFDYGFRINIQQRINAITSRNIKTMYSTPKRLFNADWRNTKGWGNIEYGFRLAYAIIKKKSMISHPFLIEGREHNGIKSMNISYGFRPLFSMIKTKPMILARFAPGFKTSNHLKSYNILYGFRINTT